MHQEAPVAGALEHQRRRIAGADGEARLVRAHAIERPHRDVVTGGQRRHVRPRARAEAKAELDRLLAVGHECVRIGDHDLAGGVAHLEHRSGRPRRALALDAYLAADLDRRRRRRAQWRRVGTNRSSSESRVTPDVTEARRASAASAERLPSSCRAWPRTWSATTPWRHPRA